MSRFFCRSLAALLFTCAALGVYANQSPTVIRHHNHGYSPLLRLYLADVLKLTLDKTKDEYGAYELVYFSEPMSPNRLKLETEKGTRIDLLFSPHWSGLYVDPGKVIPVEFPVLNGMLGLRNLIATDETWQRIKTENLLNFRELSAGLGENWIDVEIFAANNIPVVTAHNFDALFPMLTNRRFDYVPLSMLEAQTTLAAQKLAYPNLSLNRELSLFYALPFYLYINAQKPELAERLEKGVQKALQDGSVEQLFDKHFFYVRPEMQTHKRKLVVLKNPFISEEKNAFYLQQFLGRYENGFEVLQ